MAIDFAGKNSFYQKDRFYEDKVQMCNLAIFGDAHKPKFGLVVVFCDDVANFFLTLSFSAWPFYSGHLESALHHP